MSGPLWDVQLRLELLDQDPIRGLDLLPEGTLCTKETWPLFSLPDHRTMSREKQRTQNINTLSGDLRNDLVAVVKAGETNGLQSVKDTLG
jgi:hypothetical protein